MRQIARAIRMVTLSCLLAGVVPTAAIGQSGTVWAWGYNYEGELGNGTGGEMYVNNPEPVQVTGITTAVVAEAGDLHSIALLSNGTVWTWGDNTWGQLGNGTALPSWVPIQVPGLNNITAIASGHRHNLALRSDGTVWGWGENWGQLGDNTIEDRYSPVQVHGPNDVGYLDGVVKIAAGDQHSLAIRSDGTVWAWGRNNYGRLGDGTTTHRLTPVQVVGLTEVVAIAAGFDHSLAVRQDGTVWAWGHNHKGQLGDGTTTSSYTPKQVPGLTGITAVSAGYWWSLALKADGTVYGWGYNYHGELGNGTNTDSLSPVPVSGLSGAVGISCGDYHGHAVKADGTAWSWGWNDQGQLGDGTYIDRWTPVQVVTLTSVVAVDGGYSHCVAVIGDVVVNNPPVADDQWVTTTTAVPKEITLTGSDADGDPLTFHIVTMPAHGSLSGTPPNVTYTSDDSHNGSDSFTFKVNDGKTDSAPATVTIEILRANTTLFTINRTGTITENVLFRQYDLKRTTDNALLAGKTITFSVDGTVVGSATTDSGGDSSLLWTIPDGPASRTITVEFAGDSAYNGSWANATLTCQRWGTKMATFDRTARIAGRTELKARLLRSDNAPLYNRMVNFYVDGTFVISRPTNTQGYASYPYYDVPDGTGAGLRTILSEWPGNAGYAAISKTATLTVQKAPPYIWVMPKLAAAGASVRLYAYFRRLYDYAKQEGKTVTFSVDGTSIADVVTGSGTLDPGVARYVFDTTGLNPGAHTVRCAFAGDAWVEAGYGEATLTLY